MLGTDSNRKLSCILIEAHFFGKPHDDQTMLARSIWFILDSNAMNQYKLIISVQMPIVSVFNWNMWQKFTRTLQTA